MEDPAVMPARLVSLLEARGATDITIADYENMIGGYSRLMARFHATYSLDGTQHDHVLVLRGDPPAGQALIETDRTVEYDVLDVASRSTTAPKPRFLDAAGEYVGTPSLVMDFAPGMSTLPWIDANGVADLPVRLAELAGSIHTIAVDQLPPSLPRPADGTEAMSDQIALWRDSALRHVEALPVFRYVAAWLDAHRPPPVPLGLVHNDFSTANMLVAPDGTLVPVDFELASVGDPRADLGYFKAYAQAAPPDLIDGDPDAFLTRYRELTGYTEEQVNPAVLTYFLVLGVIGVVDQLRESGARMARGEYASTNIAFNMDNLLFGQAAWVAATDALTAALDGEA